MPFIETADKTTLFYNDWGRGRPVVLIHGWPLDSDMWEYQAGFLASQDLRVITYDRRGFGRSSQPWSGYDYDTLADDLKAVLDRLDLSNVTLVGHSMGGGEVARYLNRHGGARVAKTVLLASVTPFLLRTEFKPGRRGPSNLRTNERRIGRGPPRYRGNSRQAVAGRRAADLLDQQRIARLDPDAGTARFSQGNAGLHTRVR